MAERKIKMGAFKNFRAKMHRIKVLYNYAKEMDMLHAGWRYQLGASSDAPVEKYIVSPYRIGKARYASKVGDTDLVVTAAEVPLLALGDLGEDIIDSYGKDRINTDTLVGVTIGIRGYFVEPDRASFDVSVVPPVTPEELARLVTPEELARLANHSSCHYRGEEESI